MKAQKQLKRRPMEQPKKTDKVSGKLTTSKPEEITRWEGEGGTVLPTGDLTPVNRAHARPEKHR